MDYRTNIARVVHFLTRHLLRDEDTGFRVWNVVNFIFCFIRKERAEKDKNRGIKILFYFVYQDIIRYSVEDNREEN